MSAHTPGPWKVNKDAAEVSGGEMGVAHVVSFSERFTKREQADAALISAAPDLLACLVAFVENPASWQVDAGHVTRALAAIAKAEGK